MVDVKRDKDGRVRARLLVLDPGRSGEAYKTSATRSAKASRSPRWTRPTATGTPSTTSWRTPSQC